MNLQNQNVTDEDIVLQTLKEPSSFGFIIERYEAKLQRYIARLGVKNPDDAADVLQEILLKPTLTSIASIPLCHFLPGCIELLITKPSLGIVRKMCVQKDI